MSKKYLSVSIRLATFLACLLVRTPLLAQEPLKNGEVLRQLVAAGKIAELRETLEGVDNDPKATSAELCALAQISVNGSLAGNLFSRALATATGEEKEFVYLRLAQFQVAKGDLARANETIAKYFTEFPTGVQAATLTRLKTFLAEKRNDFIGARKSVENLLKSRSTQATSDWANVTLARYQLRDKETRKSAREKLFSYATTATNEAAPQAQYLLARDQVENGDRDRATLNYNILHEAYPNAVGLMDLSRSISALAGGEVKSSESAGAFYSIQVGVYADKKNANKQKNRYKDLSEPIDVVKRNLDGRETFAVYIGAFRTLEAARAFKLSLERGATEPYSIVAR